MSPETDAGAVPAGAMEAALAALTRFPAEPRLAPPATLCVVRGLLSGAADGGAIGARPWPLLHPFITC